jgi:hypothetical protein
MVPALAREVDVRVQPKFELAGERAWCVPLGDLRLLDEQLEKCADGYHTVEAHEMM